MKRYYHYPHRSTSSASTSSVVQGYRELASAVVFQAITDFRNADELFPRRKAKKFRQEIATFIHSPWFGVLCDLEPAETLKALNKGLSRRAIL